MFFKYAKKGCRHKQEIKTRFVKIKQAINIKMRLFCSNMNLDTKERLLCGVYYYMDVKHSET